MKVLVGRTSPVSVCGCCAAAVAQSNSRKSSFTIALSIITPTLSFHLFCFTKGQPNSDELPPRAQRLAVSKLINRCVRMVSFPIEPVIIEHRDLRQLFAGQRAAQRLS